MLRLRQVQTKIFQLNLLTEQIELENFCLDSSLIDSFIWNFPILCNVYALGAINFFLKEGKLVSNATV